MVVFFLHKDLFSFTQASLAQCVSSDFAMNRGVALYIKDVFGDVPPWFKNKYPVGKCVSKHSQNRGKPVTLFYLITKSKYFQKPTYHDFVAAVRNLRDQLIASGIRSVAMPLIGTGLDRLPESFVRQVLNDVFEDREIYVSVYLGAYRVPYGVVRVISASV